MEIKSPSNLCPIPLPIPPPLGHPWPSPQTHPSVDFKKEFKATNVVTNLENVKRADEYFELATAIVGKAKNGKYVAKTEKRYKSKPVGELSISSVRRRMSPYVVDL